MTPLASPGLRLTTAPGGFNPPQHRSPFTPAAYGGDLRPNTVPMNHMFGHFLQPSAELTLLPMLDTYTVRLPLPRTQRGHLSLEIGSGPCPCPPVCTLQRGGQSPGSKRVAPNSSSLAQLTRGNGERVSEYSRRMAADGVPEHAHARSGTPSCALLGPRAAGRVEYGESTPPTLAPSMMPSQTSSSAPSAAPSLAPSAGSRTQAPTDAPRSSPSHKHHRRKQVIDGVAVDSESAGGGEDRAHAQVHEARGLVRTAVGHQAGQPQGGRGADARAHPQPESRRGVAAHGARPGRLSAGGV